MYIHTLFIKIVIRAKIKLSIFNNYITIHSRSWEKIFRAKLKNKIIDIFLQISIIENIIKSR